MWAHAWLFLEPLLPKSVPLSLHFEPSGSLWGSICSLWAPFGLIGATDSETLGADSETLGADSETFGSQAAKTSNFPGHGVPQNDDFPTKNRKICDFVKKSKLSSRAGESTIFDVQGFHFLFLGTFWATFKIKRCFQEV